MTIQSVTDARAYIVYVGRQPRLYKSWDDVRKQINDFPLAWYRSFQCSKEARNIYKFWRRRQSIPIRQLLTNEKSLASPIKKHKQNTETNRKACIHWCMATNRSYSDETVRTVVRIAKKRYAPLTVTALKDAFEYYLEQPPWD
jgi:viroplasmin and RNaseH domain-containing protein